MFKTAMGLIGILLAGASACRNLNVPTVEEQARAELIDSENQIVGTVTLTQTSEGVNIVLSLVNLPPGEHALHIHENGQCTPPDFESAGGHLALPGQKHGFAVEGGPHLGDMRNLMVSDDGTAEIQRTVDGATLGEGERSLMNRAIVIHAEPDDYETQPSGAAGARITCGVITPGSGGVGYPKHPLP